MCEFSGVSKILIVVIIDIKTVASVARFLLIWIVYRRLQNVCNSVPTAFHIMDEDKLYIWSGVRHYCKHSAISCSGYISVL